MIVNPTLVHDCEMQLILELHLQTQHALALKNADQSHAHTLANFGELEQGGRANSYQATSTATDKDAHAFHIGNKHVDRDQPV